MAEAGSKPAAACPRRLSVRLLGTGDVHTPAGRAMLLEQFFVLRKQIPLLYALMVVNGWFLSFATYGAVPKLRNFAVPAVLTLAAFARSLFWLRRHRPIPEPRAIQRYLVGTLVVGAVSSAAFGGWGLLLLEGASPMQQACIALYMFVGALICSYCMQSIPSAGRIMLVFGTAPMTARLLFSEDWFLVGLGLNLVFLSFVILRMLAGSHAGFVDVLSSRSDMLAEKEKARDAERRAHQLAYRDPLTGLSNRRAVADRLEAMIASPENGRGAALLLIDLDRFKSVNDVHGHPCGDALLREVAARLTELAGQGAQAFRLGGDEFAILSVTGEDPDGPQVMAQRIVQAMSEPFLSGAMVHHIGASVGISSFPADARDSETLMRRADIALYRAKASGRGQYRSFEPAMDAEIKSRSALERELRASIGADEFRPFYQPIVELASGRTTGFELLARWPRGEPEIGPDRFIPVAEEAGLITELMLQLLDRGCREALAWEPELTIAINISPVQLKDSWLSQKILGTLAGAGFPARRLAIEITEKALIVEPDNARQLCQSLKNQGVRIALDDFGIGYSSLQHLRMLPFDEVKIDRSFILSLDSDAEARQIVRAIIGLASTLNLPVVAEGIESRETAELLREFGCTYGQGFHLGHPMPGDRVGALLEVEAASRAA